MIFKLEGVRSRNGYGVVDGLLLTSMYRTLMCPTLQSTPDRRRVQMALTFMAAIPTPAQASGFISPLQAPLYLCT